MQRVTITAEPGAEDREIYRARINGHQAVGRTAGEALDGLREHLAHSEGTTVVILQKLQADAYFGADQINRLRELMAKWRQARDEGRALAEGEHRELESLIEEELEASAKRSASLVKHAST